ncbi:MAG: transglutaminase domain-containing protein [Patescibacteria group bacterium]
METGPGTITKSFQQSRFTPTAVIWRKKQRSCGSYTTIVASVARYYKLRCKLIDGYLGPRRVGYHHAWNEIYIPVEHKYVAFDITQPSFRVGRQHQRKRAWTDWHDLEKVYNPKKV